MEFDLQSCRAEFDLEGHFFIILMTIVVRGRFQRIKDRDHVQS